MKFAKYPVGIFIGLLALWITLMDTDFSRETTLRVAFPNNGNADSYEPTQIHFTDEYVFLESIYSPLVELSNERGVPVSSVAHEFYWKGGELHFVIRDGLRTIDGHKIGVDDVITSLKRLLVLSKNTHGDFKNLVCPDIRPETMERDCPRIKKQGDNTLVLDLGEQKDFVIPMLAAIDFAIVPRSSIDPETLKIVDYRNTSGPYYVERDEGGGNIVLKANPTHFHYGPDMPQEIVLVPTRGMDRDKVVDELYKSGKLDHITTIGGLFPSELTPMNPKDNNFYESIPIQTELAYITEKGRQRLPLKERLAFAKSLQKAFHEYYGGRVGYKEIRQFFITTKGGQGFSPEIENSLRESFEKVPMERSGEEIFLGILKSKGAVLENYEMLARKYMPQLKVEQSKNIPAFSKMTDEEMPDYMIVSTDSGFLEDIGLLSYTMNAGYFGLSPKEGKAWLADYMNTQDKKERLDKIDKMHAKSLAEGLMIPLIAAPYVAVIKKPWKMHFSPLFANNQFWKIRRD